MALKWALSSAYNIVLGHPAADANPATCKFPDSQGEGGRKEKCVSGFQMPLHYPRYRKADYEKMEDWKLDLLLNEYGLNFNGNLEGKRKFAMGTFLWPDQM